MARTVEETQPSEQEVILKNLYIEVLYQPFEDKYEDKFEEDIFWTAIETFKSRAKLAGIDDPLVVLSKTGFDTYEQIRDALKEGPPKCFREGWRSELLSRTVDALPLLDRCEFLTGTKYTGKESIVVLDFWASWCSPCVKAGPELSVIAEKYVGQVAVFGINNEAMFDDREQDVEMIRHFVDDHKDAFRYPMTIDVHNHARDSVFKHCGYQAIPCLILLTNKIVSYVGSPGPNFDRALSNSLEVIALEREEKEEREEREEKEE